MTLEIEEFDEDDVDADAEEDDDAGDDADDVEFWDVLR